MKVFVVMGNDFPDSVFTTEEGAELYCEKKRAADNPRMYWKVHPFDLQGFTQIKHKKRGTTYDIIGEGKLQTERALCDDTKLIAYRSVEDGKLWFRPPSEVRDGRFEDV